MRLQLIRYESVELTEQLMREKQNGQSVEDGSGQEMCEASSVPTEMQVELRGVLLEEQRTEELVSSTEQGAQEQSMLYVFTEDLTPAGEDTVMLQLQDSAQELVIPAV